MKEKNECSKRRPVEKPYEIWVSFDSLWEYRVLKKYQTSSAEAKNPYARWFVAVKSPATFGRFSLGDAYVSDVKRGTTKVVEDYD